jgi:hypothetical protein
MRRADYLILAELVKTECAAARTSQRDARMNGGHEESNTRDAGRIAAAEGIARGFARSAHLGGLTQWDFLRACGIAA